MPAAVRTLLLAVALALSVYAVAIAALAVAGRRTAAKEVAAFLPNLARLFKGLIGDSRVPRSSKALLVFGAAWIASPIDLIPEFIPVLGPLDDAVVAALILRRVLKTAGAEVVADHWRGDPATLQRLLRLFVLRPADPKEDRSRSG
ncbi:MAG TPA: YkvA family protein [Actinomycetota bacterium]|nr:YkvA family protein [Actinomycetota bacterium]